MELQEVIKSTFEGLNEKHVIGSIPKMPTDLMNRGNNNWQHGNQIREYNIELIKGHYNFLLQQEDFQNEFSMFKGFFNAFYKVQFLQAEIFLTEIREKYPTVSMNNALMSMMEGKIASLMTILKKKVPQYDYFFEAVSKNQTQYYNAESILFNKPTDYVDFTYRFNQLSVQNIIDYWDFLQNLVEPQDSPETIALTRNMLIATGNSITRNRNGQKELLALMAEILDYSKENYEEIKQCSKPILIKRFERNLKLSAQQFKTTVLGVINATWVEEHIKEELLRVFGEWDRTFGSKMTHERFMGLFFGSLGYKNQDHAEKSIRIFFKTQKHFHHIFKELDEKYTLEAREAQEAKAA